MRHTLIMFAFLTSCLALAACDHFDSDSTYVQKQSEEDADQVADNVEKSGTEVADVARDNVKKTGDQFRSWLITPRPPPKPDNAIVASYCYHAQTDILCYRAPMPGWESRLVAYQGTNATPPTPGQTEPVPKRVADAALLPANKVINTKPVFTELPAPPKEEEKNPDQAPVFDATHEQLPNPTMSPQL